MSYKGGCHCGQIAYQVDGEPDGAISCNCSICQRKGALMWFVPRDKLRMLTPEENMKAYTFNKHTIQHYFCPTCGIHPLAQGIDQKGNTMVMINLQCLEDLEPGSLPVKEFDGRKL